MKYIKDIIYILIIVLLSILLILSHIDDNFNILTSSDWVNLFVGLLSASATILLGVIAIYQNKKAHNINDRLLNIEEFNNKTFLYFENSVVPIKLVSDEFWTFSGGRAIKETINIQITDKYNSDDEDYLFVPSCQFLGKIPANEIIINGYVMEQIDIKSGKVMNNQVSNKKIVNKIQCCKENVIYDVNMGLNLNKLNIKDLIDQNNSLRITFNITVKNIMGIENNYFIQSILSYTEGNYENDYYYMSSIIDKKEMHH